ncbi:MAG: electron transport complex subunit RsxB [gamma proteobacterium symbiont of Ctena orbiculata]|uniref:Ion-translocating oxidoreductase complex subunit B n=1 Tax=Candidatus Thiodiazotropha taylori TaxID=2792791 RepID=A0A944MER6_9GAMM|nr:electron transport complex subunit RsxB [Candidatus Thiodiazotropha taylori]PUB86955.1 MAG: electron transport complex subunit RsxB [gamma proteobacterium symbiont of Ctena orbiculata]MBT2989670.1 electron transport complex subunit RsxB [Candidatus Thiodiazotropha taylori]MBT2995991.1 electron transport complex subunit RsxB [Candidatus Thiodiazotropha taylori]MBT3001641.1 electron transport complex subunit RsxB [Candidatus Thiodiazotropha taylori]
MLVAILTITSLAALFGLLLGYANIRFHVEGDPITDQIEKLLPQTQCGQCGFAGCRPYAEALAGGEVDINLCPPGGEATMVALADLLGRDPVPLDAGAAEEKPKSIAIIKEEECIGCTLCIQACPVDAIIGAAKQMHVVISDECTGCERCLPPCPVDCILMQPIPLNTGNWRWPFPQSGLEEVAASPLAAKSG